MMDNQQTFEQLSQQVVREFLSTVVVVDDQAQLGATDASVAPHVVRAPGRQGADAAPDKEPLPDGTDRAHLLKAKPLIDSFASIGIVCAVLRPSDQEIEDFDRVLPPVAESCDVIVIDWVLYEFKQGEKTLEIIQHLLQPERPDSGRARLIIIYTGEKDLQGITSSVRHAFNLPEQDGAADPFTIHYGAAQICIYAKEETQLLEVDKHRKIGFDKLPETVVIEFSRMTSGLISNVALRSLAALRSNTHQLLRKFHRELDPPYVTHSTLLGNEEAADHLIPLIVSEIQAVLEDRGVGDLANRHRILQWLRQQRTRGLVFELPQHVKEEEYWAGLTFLVEHGVSDNSLTDLFERHKKFAIGVLKNKDKDKAKSALCDCLTKIVTVQADRPNVTDHELASLMSVRSHYSSPTPALTLGSIVLEIAGGQQQYLLCVQPRCDSVRLKGERGFPFLPMKAVSENERCDFMIEDNGSVLRLVLSRDPFKVKMVKFAPAGAHEDQILAHNRKGARVFRASGKIKNYRWVAELKTAHAQRVANQYAYQLSRVGLTESEWHRVRWLPRGDN
jgi:hypothetical protein